MAFAVLSGTISVDVTPALVSVVEGLVGIFTAIACFESFVFVAS